MDTMIRIPGLALLCGIAGLSNWLSSLVEIAGKHPIEASAIAILFGLAIQALNLPSERIKPGLLLSDPLLMWGVVFLGVGLDLSLLTSKGWTILALIVGSMGLSLGLIYWLSQRANLSPSLGLLLAAGTTICGTSAIALIAPLIKAKQEETSYAVATIACLGLLALFIYPVLAHELLATSLGFGIFAGIAIHSTPQVVGAGYLYSEISGQTATAVKLVRNCFIAPLALGIALRWNKSEVSTNTGQVLRKAFPWFLFAYFFFAGLNALALIPDQPKHLLLELGKFLIVLGMAGVGINTPLKALKSVGLKPFLIGLLGTVLHALIAAGLVFYWGI